MQYPHVHNIGRPVRWASRPLARFHQVSLEAAASAHLALRPCSRYKPTPQLRHVSAAGDAADKTEAAAGRPGAEVLRRMQHAASDGKWQGDASGRSAAGRSSSAGRGRGRAGRGASPPPAADTDVQPGGDSSTAALPARPASHKRTQSEPPAAASSRRDDMSSAAGSSRATLSSGGRGRGRSAPPAGRGEAGLRRQTAGRGSNTAGLQQRFAVGSSAAAGQALAIDAPLLTSRIKGSRDAPSLMHLVERHHNCSTFNHIHAAAALTLFAKQVQHQRLPRAQAQAWLDVLIRAATQKVHAAGPRELVNMLHAVATLQDRAQLQPSDSRFVEQLMAGLESQVSVLNEQGMSNTLWAVATLYGSKHSHSDFIQAWVREALGRLLDFNPQDLSNSLWALATLCGDQHNHSAFIQAWVREAGGRLSDFNPQALSNSLWALATLCGDQHSHSQFIQAWVREAEGRLSQFNPQNLSNSLWALATLCGDQHRHSRFIQVWVSEAEGRLSDFEPQALSNSLWALSKLGHTDCGFTARVLQAARVQLQGFKPQELSNTALALGTLRYQNPDFMRQLIQQAKSRLPDMTPQAISNTLLAMAVLNHNDAAFVDDAVRHLLQHRDRFNTQNLCNTLWALCILDHSPAAVLQPLLAEAQSMLLLPITVASHADGHQELFLQRRQAYQYLVTMEAQGHISPQLKAQHRQLWEVCQAAWAERLQQGARASFTQQQVLQAVRELPGCEGATGEQLTEDGLQSIDVALQLPDGRKVAVEVDGPMHFMVNAPDMPDGSTLWRNRMLQLRGWQVVSVPAVEWSLLGGNAEEQRAYLQQRFAKAGVQVPCNTGSDAAAAVGRISSVVLDPPAAALVVSLAAAGGEMGEVAVEAAAAAVHLEAAEWVRPKPQAAAAQGQPQ